MNSENIELNKLMHSSEKKLESYALISLLFFDIPFSFLSKGISILCRWKPQIVIKKNLETKVKNTGNLNKASQFAD